MYVCMLGLNYFAVFLHFVCQNVTGYVVKQVTARSHSVFGSVDSVIVLAALECAIFIFIHYKGSDKNNNNSK